jgi:hypothetical protein
MNEELIEKMRATIADLAPEKMASFHARFLAYLDAGLGDELREAGWIEFGHCDAMALNRAGRRG